MCRHLKRSFKIGDGRRGANIEFDERWTTDNLDLVRANAANLVELKPDVIVAIGGRVIPVLMQLTRTVPIIIPGSASPVEAGFIKKPRAARWQRDGICDAGVVGHR